MVGKDNSEKSVARTPKITESLGYLVDILDIQERALTELHATINQVGEPQPVAAQKEHEFTGVVQQDVDLLAKLFRANTEQIETALVRLKTII